MAHLPPLSSKQTWTRGRVGGELLPLPDVSPIPLHADRQGKLAGILTDESGSAD
jgi:hypothetical protein